MNFIIQGISILGMACHISSFQIKKNSLLFFAQFMGSFLFFVHYLLLGQLAGALMNIVGVISSIVFMQGDKLKKPWVIALLLVMVIGGVGLTWDGWKCIFILIAMTVSMITKYSNNGKIIRLGQLFANSPGWLTYNIIVGSIGGTLCEIFIITSTVISFIRYGINGFEKAE